MVALRICPRHKRPCDYGYRRCPESCSPDQPIANLLRQELEDAEAHVERLKRKIASGPCSETGHDWKFLGGRNAGCDREGCSCSVPVNECVKCGDCDYGDNAEARDIMDNCNDD